MNMTKHLIRIMQGLGRWLDGKAQELESTLSAPGKKPGMVACTWIPSIGEAETRGGLGFVGPAV